ncbi:hypothetical protein Btru_029221 [Bulinus truncatus]|nr:hypothetical protein Btru_029221 [Bulinus truncatus]
MDTDVLRMEEYMDVLYRLTFAPLAVPVTQGGPLNLSNNSTPDLTELISLVKPSDGTSRNHPQAENGNHFPNGDAVQYHPALTSCLPVTMGNSGCLSGNVSLSKPPVLQLHPGPTHLSSMSQPFPGAAVVSDDLDVSQPYTVMAIHLPNLSMSGSNTVSQYVMGSHEADPINVPEHAETKVDCDLFKCDQCEYKTDTYHKMNIHKVSPGFPDEESSSDTCQQRGEVAIKDGSLQSHVISVIEFLLTDRHTGQKQYRCTQCPYTCIQSISLKQHMNKHPGTSWYLSVLHDAPFAINQCIYSNHMQDHKKGLIPDRIIPPRLELLKVKSIQQDSKAGTSVSRLKYG